MDINCIKIVNGNVKSIDLFYNNRNSINNGTTYMNPNKLHWDNYLTTSQDGKIHGMKYRLESIRTKKGFYELVDYMNSKKKYEGVILIDVNVNKEVHFNGVGTIPSIYQWKKEV